jgi:hypothetical protein
MYLITDHLKRVRTSAIEKGNGPEKGRPGKHICGLLYPLQLGEVI